MEQRLPPLEIRTAGAAGAQSSPARSALEFAPTTLSRLQDGSVLITGDESAWRYRPETRTAVKLDFRPGSRPGTATVLAGNRVLLTERTPGDRSRTLTVWLFGTNAFITLAAPDLLGGGYGAAALHDGTVLFVGGQARFGDDFRTVADAVLFVPTPLLPATGSGGLADRSAPPAQRTVLLATAVALLVLALAPVARRWRR